MPGTPVKWGRGTEGGSRHNLVQNICVYPRPERFHLRKWRLESKVNPFYCAAAK